ncbi:PAS domain-containing protein [Pseudonocardia bannensis]|uniref:histidine kinase n=1 Tax=Pseudonocardia bannensis TaxID=630973 RepID=A0A848DHR4_9PSEU|nr:PAS domain-containing hybrid sensor histidine kinase/response regulator [Pseudonocardia bannensis]NMH92220.1 PAS domain-containing protein [Pseudonocardia bannensis]
MTERVKPQARADPMGPRRSAAFWSAPSPLAVVEMDTVRRGRIVDANRAFCDLLDTTAEQLIGRPFDQVVELPPGRSGVLAQVAAGWEPLSVPAARCIRPDGRHVWVGLRASVVPGEVGAPHQVVIALDDHADHAALARGALRNRMRYLQDIVENSPALIYVKDDQGRFVYINKYFGSHFGVRTDEVVGETDFYVFPDEIARVFSVNDKLVRDTRRAQEFEEPAAGPHGAYRSVKFPLFDESGRLFAVAGISTEISDLKRAEAAAREARDEAERASRAKSELLSRMSHELRTPLNSILGFGQLLQLQPLSDDAHSSVDRIIRAGNHLLALINDVLEQSRIQAGHLLLSLEPVHAVDPVMEAIELLRPLAARCGVELSVDLHGGLYEFVVADYQRLKQVLLNVVSNGIKYNRENGSVRVSFEQAEPGRLRCLVADTGPGLEPADLDQLFLPFERLAAARSDTEGTGLGLALSKGLVEAMGGSIGVMSGAGGSGSTFYIDLPAADPPPDAHTTVFGTREAPVFTVPSFAPTRILYIENDDANVELARRAFALCDNIEFRVARTGAAGLGDAARERPALILLDLHLPDMAGETVLDSLREDPRTSDVPIAVLSADATGAQIERLTALGVADYITKPVDVVDLLRRVHALVHPAHPGTGREPADD